MIQGVQQPLHAPISWPNQLQSCWKTMKAHVYSNIYPYIIYHTTILHLQCKVLTVKPGRSEP